MSRTVVLVLGLAILSLGAAACDCGGTNGGSGRDVGSSGAGADAAVRGGASDGGASDGDTGAPSALSCEGVGPVWPMSDDPDTGAVDISEYCLARINSYRSGAGLQPFTLRSTSDQDVCCQAAEAKSAAETGGHVNGGCGWQAQGFCGGGRNPDGTVQASVDWCPRLFFEEGPTGGHYQAMMGVEPRAIMCSFYAVSRDRHSIVVNYY